MKRIVSKKKPSRNHKGRPNPTSNFFCYHLLERTPHRKKNDNTKRIAIRSASCYAKQVHRNSKDYRLACDGNC